MFQKDKNAQASAEVKEGALVLYLPKALKPCVWRIDLDILSETSIEIDEKDGIYILATRDINGVIKSIAGFQVKDDAQEALSLTLNALMSNGGSSSSGFGAFKNIPFGKIIKWGLLALIILWLGSVLLGTPPAPVENASVVPSQNSSVLDDTGHLKVGVPVDVDSLFEQAEE